MTDIPQTRIVHDEDVDDTNAVVIVTDEDGTEVLHVPDGVRVVHCEYLNGDDPREVVESAPIENYTLGIDEGGDEYVRSEFVGPYDLVVDGD